MFGRPARTSKTCEKRSDLPPIRRSLWASGNLSIGFVPITAFEPLGIRKGREMKERLLNPISDAELDRRCTAVRKAMAYHGVEAVILRSNNHWRGGPVTR